MGLMNMPWSNFVPLWAITSKAQWQQNSLALQTIWWNILMLLGIVIKFHTHRRSISMILFKEFRGNLMPLLFQFQIVGSWWASFVRESILFQFREESSLLFQEIAPCKIYPAVQGQGGGSYPCQTAGMTMKWSDTKKNYRLAGES